MGEAGGNCRILEWYFSYLHLATAYYSESNDHFNEKMYTCTSRWTSPPHHWILLDQWKTIDINQVQSSRLLVYQDFTLWVPFTQIIWLHGKVHFINFGDVKNNDKIHQTFHQGVLSGLDNSLNGKLYLIIITRSPHVMQRTWEKLHISHVSEVNQADKNGLAVKLSCNSNIGLLNGASSQWSVHQNWNPLPLPSHSRKVTLKSAWLSTCHCL